MRKLLANYFKKVNERFVKKHNLQPIAGSENQWFYIEIIKYRGKEVLLNDGTRIMKGDQIGEIHLNNEKVTEHVGDIRFVFRAIEEECTAIAHSINQGNYKDVKAFWGITLMYPLAEKKGFEVREMKSKRKSFQLGLWESLIKYALEKNKTKFRLRKPKEIWMSYEKVQIKYNKEGR